MFTASLNIRAFVFELKFSTKAVGSSPMARWIWVIYFPTFLLCDTLVCFRIYSIGRGEREVVDG